MPPPAPRPMFITMFMSAPPMAFGMGEYRLRNAVATGLRRFRGIWLFGNASRMLGGFVALTGFDEPKDGLTRVEFGSKIPAPLWLKSPRMSSVVGTVSIAVSASWNRE